MRKTTCIVMAGGSGSRMGMDFPKSLLKHNQRCILEYTLDEVEKLDIEKIVVCTNRVDYLNDYEAICCNYPLVDLKISGNHSSTFLVLREVLNFNDSNILFLYGHSPNSYFFYERLLTKDEKIRTSIYLKSSKRKIYKPSDSCFAEPPYFIPARFLKKQNFNSWKDFLEANSDYCEYVLNDGPNEFNFQSEYNELVKYLDQV